MRTVTFDETKWRLTLRDPDETMRAAGGGALEHADNPSTWGDAKDVFIAMLDAAPEPPVVNQSLTTELPASVAPPALYQHDDGRYALALGDVARHKLTYDDPGWHRVPLDVVFGAAPKPATVDDDVRRDAERYRYLRAHARDAHMWSDESIDAAMAEGDESPR